ncbi:MAG TPA: hypothetical protein VM869_20015 [Enhygromyxa sp.]|nr:hypothetical protein [Enhygromyxa sp.]
MQEQRQAQTPERQVELQPERREDFELTLPDGTDVSEIRIEVGQLNDINFGF